MKPLTVAALVAGGVTIGYLLSPALPPPDPHEHDWVIQHWRTQHYYSPEYNNIQRARGTEYFPSASACGDAAKMEYPEEVKNQDITCGLWMSGDKWFTVTNDSTPSADPYNLDPSK
jgi:hypothetical protein